MHSINESSAIRTGGAVPYIGVSKASMMWSGTMVVVAPVSGTITQSILIVDFLFVIEAFVLLSLSAATRAYSHTMLAVSIGLMSGDARRFSAVD